MINKIEKISIINNNFNKNTKKNYNETKKKKANNETSFKDVLQRLDVKI